MIEWPVIQCPYCMEFFDTAVDCSVEGRQVYTEDCQVCCQPILFEVDCVEGGLLGLEVRAENG